MADRYLALIGDLIASRQMEADERRRIQDGLSSHFAALAADARPGLASLPLVTLGDEFQGLFRADAPGAAEVMRFMPTIVEIARPEGVRFGLGVGELTTDLQPEALGMDGPCFHRARASLSRARAGDLHCQLETGQAATDALWGALASYALRDRAGWTEAQSEAINLYEKLGAWNKVADSLQVTRGAVSLRQRAAGWPLYHHAWQVLGKGLAEIIDDERRRS